MNLEFKGSKGNWSVGKHYGVVVTDDPDRFDGKDGHADTLHYGGFLIGESILKIEDARLIAAAPDLLRAAIDFIEKVDRGEARSVKSYAKFFTAVKKALG